MSAPPAILRPSEAQFLAAIVDLARLRGWKVFHPFDSRRSEPGWPDLTLVRRERLLFAELKTERGHLSDEQRAWLQSLELAGAESYVWRPSMWEQIEDILQ